MGTVSIAAADKIAEFYTYYSENKNRALFYHNILVWGDESSVISVATRVMGQLNSDSTISTDVKIC